MSIDQAPGFPREEFGALVRRLPAYARLAWALAMDPRLSKARRAVVLAGAAYVISPIDLVPGVVPVLGQLDDLAIALGVIRFALDGLKPEYRAERLAAAGLSEQALSADIATTRAIAAWLARSGIRAGRRLASAAADAGGRAADRALEAGSGLRRRLAGLRRRPAGE